MRIHYLGNSGFFLEQEGGALVVDCYNPQAHPWLEGKLAAAREAAALVSHSHEDHYSPDLCRLAQGGGAALVLWEEIQGHPGALLIAPGRQVSIPGGVVRALGSTDEGVSFLINWGGKTIFHAGDLNNWHWQQDSTPEEAALAEAAFLSILADIAAIREPIDLAFFPLDPRMGEDYGRGAMQFVQALQPKTLVPMHFGQRWAAVQDAVLALARHAQVAPLKKPGDTLEL